jgi:hypothetical protein
MDHTDTHAEQPQQEQGNLPAISTYTQGVVVIILSLITDIQDVTYADETEEQVGIQRAELRITIDRDQYTDVYADTNAEPSQE